MNYSTISHASLTYIIERLPISLLLSHVQYNMLQLIFLAKIVFH